MASSQDPFNCAENPESSNSTKISACFCDSDNCIHQSEPNTGLLPCCGSESEEALQVPGFSKDPNDRDINDILKTLDQNGELHD
jgi:hypothetical protein